MIERFKRRLNQLDFDYVKMAPITGAISAILVIASWIVFFAIGPNWGIDFTGGTEIHLKFAEETRIGEVRDALGQLGLSEDTVQQVGDDSEYEFTVRIADATFGSEDLRTDIETRLRETFGADWIDHTTFDAEVGARLGIYYKGPEVTPQAVAAALDDLEGIVVQLGRDDRQIDVNLPGMTQVIEREIHTVMGDRDFEVLAVDAVGPKVGAELRRQGFLAVFATMVLILVYVAFRFDLSYAPGAVICLFHDVSVTIGIFVLIEHEFNLPMIGALLTIVGYSLNDTIVIFDRIRENHERYRRKDLRDLLNVSINETMSRTLATSVTTLLAISPFLLFGGRVISDFALAMTLGIVFGTYSTIYVASPLILVMERVKPRLAGFVAGSAPAAPEEGEEGQAPLTQSEQRRRERASHDGAPSV